MFNFAVHLCGPLCPPLYFFATMSCHCVKNSLSPQTLLTLFISKTATLVLVPVLAHPCYLLLGSLQLFHFCSSRHFFFVTAQCSHVVPVRQPCSVWFRHLCFWIMLWRVRGKSGQSAVQLTLNGSTSVVTYIN